MVGCCLGQTSRSNQTKLNYPKLHIFGVSSKGVLTGPSNKSFRLCRRLPWRLWRLCQTVRRLVLVGGDGHSCGGCDTVLKVWRLQKNKWLCFWPSKRFWKFVFGIFRRFLATLPPLWWSSHDCILAIQAKSDFVCKKKKTKYLANNDQKIKCQIFCNVFCIL